QSARKIDELALADRKRRAALIDARGRAVGKGTYEFAEANFFERAFDHDVVDVVRTEADIGLDRPSEEKRILEDDAELAAQILKVDGANVFAIEKDLAALNVVKTEKE